MSAVLARVGGTTPGIAGNGVARHLVSDGAARPDPVRMSVQAGAVSAAGPGTGYEHLVPLFGERAALPEGHPRRKRLRDELISGHLSLARNIARKYAYRGDNPEDLQQVASVGLVLAVDRFDPGRGTDFLSFAVPTISGEVLRYFRDRACTIRTPRRLRALQSMVYEAVTELAQRHGRAPRPSEIAAHLDVDVEVVLQALSAQNAVRTASLDEPAADDDASSGRPRLEAALAHIEEEFDLVEQREALAPLLAALPERERRILLMRFFGGLTQTEIGAKVGISQMHVSRLLARTLAGLRRQLAAD
jgi:RNA polymerase sigma-B factor